MTVHYALERDERGMLELKEYSQFDNGCRISAAVEFTGMSLGDVVKKLEAAIHDIKSYPISAK